MSKRHGNSKTALIKFHDAHDPQYGALSPLSPHPIIVRHQEYPSLHHYFICERFAGSEFVSKLLRAASVWEMERLVADAEAAHAQRGDWGRVKIDVMLLGNYLKFRQHDGPRSVLLGTGSGTLVNHTPLDDFWGDAGDGSGKNLLGVVLTAVRERLQRETAQEEQRKKETSGRTKGGAAGTGVRAARSVAASRH